ncbi:FAD-dependent monooxygenase [Streptomyces sp. NPDC001404]|uniref:FAD-dependent monooxygenase n=1 Tax=Streptomyces sp. NPDC001404 TaxID=3364571 RepID=UPI0036CD35A7
MHSPFGGHGMNTGIQDTYNLGWKLGLVLHGISDEGLLDTCQTEQLPVARAVLADSDRRFSAATPPRGPHVTLLTLGTGPTPKIHRVISRLKDHIRAYAVVPAEHIAFAGPATLVDPTGHLFRVYGAREGTLVVIRPDGCIGFIAHRPAGAALRNYCHRLGIRLPRTSEPAPYDRMP